MEEVGLMYNTASRRGITYVTRTADLVEGQQRQRGSGWEEWAVGKGNKPKWLPLIR